MAINIVAFSGSLRKASFTTKLVKAFKHYAPENIDLNIADISTLPLINQDMEDNLPCEVINLHKTIKEADAFLFATPEYNRSYSPVLKNAIDWGSRPQGKNSWDKKPAAVIGCSPYKLGAFGAVNHLRQVLLYVNTYVMQQPEFYLSEAAKAMDEEGKIIDKETEKMIIDFWKKYEDWINHFISK